MIFHRRINAVQYAIWGKCHIEPYGAILYYWTLSNSTHTIVQEQEDKKDGDYVSINRPGFVSLSVFEIL